MSADLGLLILRVVVGLLVAAHGSQKLFGWFGGQGFAKSKGLFGGYLRLRPAFVWTLMGALSEFGGGLLLAVGLLSPLGSLGVIAAMTMAIATVHWGRWMGEGGSEYPFTLLASALAAGLVGPGRFSLDGLLGIALPEPVTLIAGLVLVALGVATALGTRRPAAQAAGTPQVVPAAQAVQHS